MKANADLDHIVKINTHIRDFWAYAWEWAPRDAALLLSKSRLDLQVSLSHALELWLEPCAEEQRDGRLILAWANLGSLIEGTLQWFLSVYEGDYSGTPVKTWKGKELDIDGLQLAQLRRFFDKHVWTSDDLHWSSWIEHVGRRRNAIHAFRDRDLGTIDEFAEDVSRYGELVSELDGRVPYPDDNYGPYR